MGKDSDKGEPKRNSSFLVIGGGISGIRSALELADQGKEVHLVEKRPSIGGKMAQLDKTFPTLDCSLCILAPYMVEVDRHEHIKLHAYSKLAKLEGESGNFKATIRKKARGIDLEKCTGCGKCSEVCPVSVPSDYDAGMGKRSAIYVPFPQAVPKAAVIDFENCKDCGACEEVCKTGAINRDQGVEDVKVNIGAVIVATGYEEYKPNGEEPGLPYDHPNVVTGLELERLLCASGPTGGEVRRPGDGEHPKNVAIVSCVGSRDCQIGNEYCSRACCMFSAKQSLLLKEHDPDIDVTIFNIDTRVFGKGFQKFVNRAKEQGTRYIKAKVGKIWERGQDLLIRYENPGTGGITEEKFDLVMLASGFVPPAGQHELLQTLSLDKAEVDGFIKERDRITSPIETERKGIYLAGVAQGPKDITDSVTQGLGAAAKASSLLRGSQEVEEEEKEFPMEKGEEPRIGVFICHCGTNIAGTVDVKEVEEEVSDIPGVVHVERNLYTCSSEGTASIKKAIKSNNLNRVVVAACTPRTHEPLFMDTCLEAGLNPYLFEMANIRNQCSWVHQNEPEKATEKAIELVRMNIEKARRLEPLKRERAPVKQEALVIGGGPVGMQAAIDIASQGFPVHLVEKDEKLGGKLREMDILLDGRKAEDILAELTSRVREEELINIHPGREVVEVNGHVGDFTVDLSGGKEINVGTILVAIGDREHNPPEGWESDKTYTHQEFEEYLETHSHYGSTAFVQCVDQRCEDRMQCSRYCCMTSLKQAKHLKEENPESNVYVLYRDIQAFGRGHEQLYNEVQEAGVRFIPYSKEQPPKLEDDTLKVHDISLNRDLKLRPDNIVLATGSDPPEDAKELSQTLKIPLDENGYFLEAHPKLRPVDAPSDGIYLAGAAQGPKELPNALSQASAAAMRAVTPLARGYIKTKAITPEVDEDKCIGCGLCKDVCEFGAIEIENKTAKITETVCKGCGACGASCPRNAITMKHYTDHQLIDMIGALTGGE